MKKICRLLAGFCALLLLAATGCADTKTKEVPHVIETVGMYSFGYYDYMSPFWKSCGINTLQYAVNGMECADEAALQAYCDTLYQDVAKAHADGFKVYIGLLTNFRTPQEGEAWYNALFDPHDEAEMSKRLDVLAKTAVACREAEGFTIFGGDPGGFRLLPAVESANADTYIYLCRRFIEVLRQQVPGCNININPWAIADFQTPTISPDRLEYWLREDDLCRQLLATEDFIGSDNIGVELSCNDYYRGLALRQYYKEYLPECYPLFPLQEDIQSLYDKGCTRRWAWPYFLLDESDNGDGSGAGVQLETRYIHQLITQLRDLGINGVFGNWSGAGAYNRALNVYAYCRMCTDAAATPEQVIDEYAAKNVEAGSVAAFAKALRYIENNSHWHKTLPNTRQLEPLETVASAEEALALLETVQPLTEWEGLMEAPADYIARVKNRLQYIATEEANRKK